MKHTEIILSCEHATNSIPERWESLFAPYVSMLQSHRGIDFGASETANHLANFLSCICIQSSVSRLLIDCNRSIGHQHCFSEITKYISQDDKHAIIQGFYLPYRRAVEHSILENIKEGKRVYHFSMHSFTPVMDNIVRNTDIGLLYDPGRPLEKQIASALRYQIKQLAPELKVRMNYPYLGISNGFTRTLRKLFSKEQYSGIEIEINQSITGHSFEEDGQIITLPATATFEKLKQVLAISIGMLQ